MYMKSRLHQAIVFAAKAHEGQNRKGVDIPYISHPFEVAQILTEAGACEDVIIAGLLHDTLEDTSVTSDEILDLFGARVLKLVTADSEDKTKRWEQRKQATIDYVSKAADLEELMVICADKVSNLRSLHASKRQIGNAVWNSFARGADKQKWYYENLGNTFCRKLTEFKMVKEYKELFLAVFDDSLDDITADSL